MNHFMGFRGQSMGYNQPSGMAWFLAHKTALRYSKKQGFAQQKKPTRMASWRFTTNKLKPTNMGRC
jgi:hypothetical protein